MPTATLELSHPALLTLALDVATHGVLGRRHEGPSYHGTGCAFWSREVEFAERGEWRVESDPMRNVLTLLRDGRVVVEFGRSSRSGYAIGDALLGRHA